MKKILFGLMVIAVAGSFGSCKKFLDRHPLSQLEGDAINDSVQLKTASDAESAIAAVYSGMKNASAELFMLDYYVNGDAQSDNAYAGADNPMFFQIDDYNLNSANDNVRRDWGYYYTMVARCNNVIVFVPRVPDPALSASRKDEMIGEAAFMRAFLYFGMVRLWGDVPLITKEVPYISAGNFEEVYELLYPARNTKEEVYAQVIADLETAIAKAPTAYGPTKFRGTKAAAHALLAEVYATIEPHDWAKVNQHCDAVIAGGFNLLPNYDFLWDGAHENSAEAIFELDCTDWNSGGQWGVFMFAGTDWKKFNTPTEDLVDVFTAEGDNVRKNASIVFADVSGSWTDSHWPSATYPFVNKFRDFSGGQNQVLIRLAHIYLLKAEALIELNQLDNVTGAQHYINLVRNRVGLGNTPATTQADLRAAVAKERRLELAFEGYRWYDLKRTGTAIPVMTALGYNLTENKLLWPIPQTERDKNVNLTQNPGY
jgi:hypothetical protein